jgi:hypothetical protein
MLSKEAKPKLRLHSVIYILFLIHLDAIRAFKGDKTKVAAALRGSINHYLNLSLAKKTKRKHSEKSVPFFVYRYLP